MDNLNYHHLYYFWTVAREGSITKACQILNLAQPTISAQLSSLEASLGVDLFTREGRRLVLTDAGRMALGYADSIFLLGREMVDVLKRGALERPEELKIGILDSVPKAVAHMLIKPALLALPSLRIVCREDNPEELLAALAIHDLDIVISDSPAPSNVKIQSFSHFLGESRIASFGSPRLVKELKGNFPKSLDGTSIFLPLSSSALRRELEQWFQNNDIRPVVVGEVQDGALLKLMASSRDSVFFAPSVVEEEVMQSYGAQVIGLIPELNEKYYAISVERKLKHPAVIAMSEKAKNTLLKAA